MASRKQGGARRSPARGALKKVAGKAATPKKAPSKKPARTAPSKAVSKKATVKPARKTPSRKAVTEKAISKKATGKAAVKKAPSRAPASGKAATSTLATARKDRTIVQLRRQKARALDSLPRIEEETAPKTQSLDAVVDRSIALLAVAARGVHAPPEFLAWFAREFDLLPRLSSEEKAFWKQAKPGQKALAKFSWRWEALVVLLWSLGFIPELGRPTTPVDPSELVLIVKERGPEQLRAEARLRSPRELLDFAERIYRYHWAVRDAQLKGRPTAADLNPDMVMEWDQAARWLIGQDAEEWDDITLDT